MVVLEADTDVLLPNIPMFERFVIVGPVMSVELIVPFTSNLNCGAVVPIPTFPSARMRSFSVP